MQWPWTLMGQGGQANKRWLIKLFPCPGWKNCLSARFQIESVTGRFVGEAFQLHLNQNTAQTKKDSNKTLRRSVSFRRSHYLFSSHWLEKAAILFHLHPQSQNEPQRPPATKSTLRQIPICTYAGREGEVITPNRPFEANVLQAHLQQPLLRNTLLSYAVCDGSPLWGLRRFQNPPVQMHSTSQFVGGGTTTT